MTITHRHVKPNIIKNSDYLVMLEQDMGFGVSDEEIIQRLFLCLDEDREDEKNATSSDISASFIFDRHSPKEMPSSSQSEKDVRLSFADCGHFENDFQQLIQKPSILQSSFSQSSPFQADLNFLLPITPDGKQDDDKTIIEPVELEFPKNVIYDEMPIKNLETLKLFIRSAIPIKSNLKSEIAFLQDATVSQRRSDKNT